VIRWWRKASIRVRLTAWYTAVLSLLLVVYAAATFLAVRHEFREQLEDRLLESRAASRPAPADDAEAEMQRQLEEILVVLAAGLPLVVGLAGIGGYVLARRALAPIDHLAADARRITADRLHERLRVANEDDEIGRLAAVINDAFARLDASFAQLRRFTADASHELRTPLSVMRGTGEMGLRGTRTAAEYQDTIGTMLEEVDRLTRLVDTLLRLSRGDAGTIRLDREVVDLGQLAREVTSSLGVLAEERRQRLRLELADGVRVSVDRLVFREAVANVIDNAFKYSPEGSEIRVSVHAVDGRAALSVADAGPGIATEHRDRVFDRFYRIDEGRSREMGGAGLGLAIARWAVEANAGEITVDPSDAGSVFRISLPRVTS
jgi:heavy metal sensor kinase